MAATVTVEEATGVDGTSIDPTSFIHILGIDDRSRDATYYLEEPVRVGVGGSLGNSFERWFRLSFAPPFFIVSNFRYWIEGLDIPTGWDLRFGVYSGNFTGVRGDSSRIATGAPPTVEPATANIGGDTVLDGSATRKSHWIVLQASVSASATEDLILDHRFKWSEEVAE